MMSAYIVIANKIYIPLERNDNHKAFWDQGFAISFILLEMVTASSKPLLMLCKMSGVRRSNETLRREMEVLERYSCQCPGLNILMQWHKIRYKAIS